SHVAARRMEGTGSVGQADQLQELVDRPSFLARWRRQAVDLLRFEWETFERQVVEGGVEPIEESRDCFGELVAFGLARFEWSLHALRGFSLRRSVPND